jgi:hypothetical protein
MPRNAVNQAPKKTLRSNPEAMLQAKIMATLSKMAGCTVWRNNVGTAVYEGGARVEYGVGGKGAPDLLCEVIYYSSALALWLEVKTPDGVIEEHQKRWHTAARHGVQRPDGVIVGGGRNVAVVRSVEDAVLAVETVMLRGCIVAGFEVEQLSAMAEVSCG